MEYLPKISGISWTYYMHIISNSFLRANSMHISAISKTHIIHISGGIISVKSWSNISLSKPEANYRHIPGTSQTCPFQKYIVSIRGKMNRNNSENFEYPFETGISGKKRIIRIKISHIRLYLIIRLIFGFRFLLKRIVILKNPYSFNTLTDSSFEKSGSV